MRSPLTSQHRLPGDTNGRAPTALQALADTQMEHASRLDGHDGRLSSLESNRPFRGVERAMLVVLCAIAALTLGAVVGLAYEAHRIVQFLQR